MNTNVQKENLDSTVNRRAPLVKTASATRSLARVTAMPAILAMRAMKCVLPGHGGRIAG